ncbi:AbrB family transcriptional regulator [Brevibacillus panacihumi W25]|uniref:AbrB family transcriptional regulator n=1 Tax=Brevibacillus panacihumi W25 TaxID=1408254 RepID=V6MB31_9BACL|nr:AbrB/MazE/SpoVT family DNA-binding domain-containing protein [Brevibacillus panacihumi]EST55749.1 AbrB family transcriptional regulator [Brevibacillus panacihumi W25]
MNSIGVVRHVDELGRVVIPAEVRQVLDIKIKDPLEIFIDKDKEIIILGKYAAGCVFCDTVTSNRFKGKLVCSDCSSSARNHSDT